MKTLILIIMAFIAISTENSIIPFLYGGTKARQGQFPHQARIEKADGKNHCSGVIMTNRWILTARHCFRKMENAHSQYNVIVGTIDVSDDGVGDVYKIKELIGHEDPGKSNDIGLLKVEESIRFNENVKPIEIGDGFIVGGVQVTVSGWGRTPYGRVDTLMYINVKTISNENCKRIFSSKARDDILPITNSELCTLAQEGIGTCKGDSGSGMVRKGKLFGIVSRAVPCALGLPDIYVRVFSFKNWIKKIIDTR